jgi:60kDa lysophospholipase
VLEFGHLLDSSSIDAKGWTLIASTIKSNYASFDGFIILHGTDSLAYSASALSFMLEDLTKPVILTGSQAPIFELQTDATDNLLDSLILAGHFRIPEVCICFQHKLFRGNRCTKTSANQFDAFASPNLAPLAVVTSSQIHVDWSLIRRQPTPTAANDVLQVQMDLDTTHVACLRIFPGIKPEMIEAVLRVSGLRGLVLETFGAGNAPSGPDNTLIKVFSEAVQRGIVIVNVTQCLTGSVSPLYAPAMVLGRAGIVPGGDLTTEATLTKLSYLLALPDLTPTEITRRMALSLRGELTPYADVSFGTMI